MHSRGSSSVLVDRAPHSLRSLVGSAPEAAPRHEEPEPLHGEISFASPEAQVQRTAELLGAGAVVATVPPLPATMRRRLAEHVDDYLERELDARGAPTPYLAAWSPLAEDAPGRLADQLHRAREVGASGIAIVLGTLARTAAPALAEEDSATLRLYAEFARTERLVLVLDDGDAMIAGYTDPVALPELLRGREPESGVVLVAAPHEPHIDMGPADVDTVMEAVVAPKPVEEELVEAPKPSADLLELIPPSSEDVAEEPLAREEERRVISLQLDLDLDDVEEEVNAITKAEAEAQAEARAKADEAQARAEAEAVARAEAMAVAEAEAAAAAAKAEADAKALAEAEAKAIARVEAERVKAEALRARRESREKQEATRESRAVQHAHDYWRGWVQALAAARGPQPLAAFEKVFVEAYMPLASAITQGLDDARALRAYDEFRQTFERSYADAFATFGVTSRRPRLVMDAYDLVAKQARLHNARVGHVVVVDSMRLDVGAMIRDELAHRAAGMASLTSESLLFAALPSTTIRQLETLARGLDALRAPARPSDEEQAESLRGRTADTVRRMRVGSRELYKLDSVASTLAHVDPTRPQDGSALFGMLETAASNAAEALVHHIETLAPRTLLLVLGDHGFTVDRRGQITHGGASPEEVIVPAYAFLVGDLH